MKRFFKTFAICLCALMAMSLAGCSGSKKYSFTHVNGVVSSFTLDFDALTGSYKGSPMRVVLSMGSDYKYGDSGATERCSGTLVLVEDFGEDSSKFYEFHANSDVNWTVDLSVGPSRDRIKVYINGRSYVFT